jgi:hypothetical protein
MHHESIPTRRPTATTFAAGDNAHLAAGRLEHLGFRAAVTWLDDGGWELDDGELTLPDTEAGAREHVQRVADQYSDRVDHAHAGWRSATLELVRPSVPPAPGELAGLWTRLTEAAENHDPSPLTTLCAEWAAELERRFDFDPPVDDGWVAAEVQDA